MALAAFALALFGGGVEPTQAQERVSGKDFSTTTANADPKGVWSNSTTIWVADREDTAIYAYELDDADGNGIRNERILGKEIGPGILGNPGNSDPEGIWSDGTTLWVVDNTVDKVFAYELEDANGNGVRNERLTAKEFDTHADNASPAGIWSDGTTVWIGDYFDGKIYAYNLSDGARVGDRDIDNVTRPTGMWSDGLTLWVSGRGLSGNQGRTYAYNLSDGMRDSGRDIGAPGTYHDAGNRHPWGVWSDGYTMWVADSLDNKLYAYSVPRKLDAPTNLGIRRLGDGRIRLAWGAPDLSRFSVTVQGYHIEVSVDGMTWTDLVRNTGTAATSYTYDGPADGSVRHYRVSAIGDIGGISKSSITASTRDQCLADAPLSAGGRYTGNGSWTDVCESGRRPGSLARYYTFELSERREVRVGVSAADTLSPHVYLISGGLYSGPVLAEPFSSANSEVYRVLDPGVYIVEALNRNAGQTGSFTLNINTRTLSAPPATTGDVPASCLTVNLEQAGTYEGQWGPGPSSVEAPFVHKFPRNHPCRSTVTGGHARFYDFQVDSRRSVTITLESDHATPRVFLRWKDEWMQIRQGQPHIDRELTPHYTGQYSNGKSRLSATLDPGSYTIHAVSNEPGQRGEFKLTVSGSISKVPDLPVEPAPESCQFSYDEATGLHIGQWGPGCESTTYGYPAQYARYYHFTLSERKQVTVKLTDFDDPNALRSLVLRENTTISGFTVTEFGHILGHGQGETDTEGPTSITMDLDRGTYTIEAMSHYPNSFVVSYTVSDPSTASGCHGRTLSVGDELSGRWFSDCPASTGGGRYAANYDLNVSGAQAGRINVRLRSDYQNWVELYLWNASDFTGSGSDRTRNVGATPLASHTARSDDKPQRAELHVDLAQGDYVVEAVSANPGEGGAFTLGATSGVEVVVKEPVPDVCRRNRFVPTPDVPGQVVVQSSLASGRSDNQNDPTHADYHPPGHYYGDDPIILGTGCVGTWPGASTWNFFFYLDAKSHLNISTGRTAGEGVQVDANAAVPAYTLRQTSNRPAPGEQKWSYLDSADAPALDCVTAGSPTTAPCPGAGGEHRDLEPGGYSIFVTFDPPSGTSTVIPGGPFSIGLALAAAQGLEPPVVGNADPVSNQPPVFSAAAEDQRAAVYTPFEYTVPAATDPEGDAIVYWASLYDGSNLPDWLSFDPETLTFTGSPDADAYPAELSVQVVADDDGEYRQSGFTEFTLTVDPAPRWPEGVNNWPYFDRPVGERSVPENSPAGTNVGAPIRATDADGDVLGYRVHSDAFDIDPATGQLTTSAGVTYDYETRARYEFSVEVTDDSSWDLVTVTVNITDVAEAGEPNDGTPGGLLEEVEATPATSCYNDLGTLTATARYAGDWYSVDCRAHHQDSRGRYFHFTLDEETEVSVSLSAGALYLSGDTRDDWGKAPKGTYEHRINVRKGNGKLVHEGSNSATLTLAAGTYTAEAAQTADSGLNFTLEIAFPDEENGNDGLANDQTATPDTTPTVADTSKFKTYYATVGQSFSLVLPAADAASGNGGPYAYALLKRGDGTAFSANGLSFDASTRTLSGTPTAEDTHELAYQIHDADTNKAKSDAFVEETKLKVVVLPGGTATGDGQQQAPANRVPAFDAGIVTTLAVDENSGANVNVGSPITATDPDEGDTVTYSLSGTDAASFDIGSAAGQITTKTNVTYDFETKSSYTLAVEATDGKLTASTPVTIDLNDVNEAPSLASDADTTMSVDENSAAGTKVGSVFTATDPDEGDTLAYSLSGDDAAAFNIGALTGQIATKSGETYNYEAKSSYSLTVVVSDSGGLTDSIAVTVGLNDVAEAPTVSDATQFKNHAATVGQTFSLTLPAADANSGDGGPYEYLLWHRGHGQNFMDQAINGLSFDATTRTLSGTPEAAGVWTLSYVVHDDDDDRSVADRFRARTNLQVTVSE